MVSRHKLFNYHQSLLGDTRRTEAFQRAINETVKSGDIVVDLGCGSGVLSLLACAAGAKRVYSIERGDVIEVARALVAANGFGDRVVFLEGSSRGVVVPEQADVLIGEIVGNGGLEENILGFFADAQMRFLAPGGTTIPCALEIHAAPVCVPELFLRMVGVWGSSYGFDFSSIRPWSAQQTYPVTFREADLRSAPSRVAIVDLTKPTSPFMAGAVEFAFNDATDVHGFGVWFRMELIPGVTLTNAPPVATPSWNHLFLPLAQPLAMVAGSVLAMDVSTYDGLVWRWRGEHRPAHGAPVQRFDHSTFTGFPFRKKDGLPSSDVILPASADRREAVRFVIEATHAGATVESVGVMVFRTFPTAFRTAWAATQFVSELVRLLSGD